MTEVDWLSATDPKLMLAYLEGKASDRKSRLFACGYLRLVWHLLTEKRCQKVVEVSELYADGLVKRQALSGARRQGWAVATTCPSSVAADDNAWMAATRTVENHYFRKTMAAEVWMMDQCHVLRDIFGDPFHPVSPTPEWLTSTVVALAEGIYQDRAFDRMPILADALEDAGCDNENILNHCRGDGPHVRGCWVVDLVLGKN